MTAEEPKPDQKADQKPEQKPEQKADQTRFFPVPLNAVELGIQQVDLHIRFDTMPGQPTLYRATGLEFSKSDSERLAEQGVKFLYISASQHAVFRNVLCERLNKTFSDPTVAASERGRIIREACTKMIEDVLLFPGEPEPIAAINDISKRFGEWSSADPEGFSYLLDMSNHDFYTTTHMINVGVGCGLLAKEVFPGDAAMFALIVQGGLLHDVGKRGIAEALLNKEGRLNEAEWRQMRAHPTIGFTELKKNTAIPQVVLEMARDHHERLDGKGYPNGLTAEKISVPARICAIVDVFDAITAARPYRGPTPPVKTLEIMRDGRGNQFDCDLFDRWVAIVGKMMTADPARGAVANAGAPAINLYALSPSPPPGFVESSVAGKGNNLWGDERRIFFRQRCEIPATASFVRQGKTYGVQLGESFDVRVVDISRGGVMLATPWPLSQNDVLRVRFMARDTQINRTARVVRVRRGNAGVWVCGLSFVQEDAGESKAA